MALLADLVIDCSHPASLARFWQDVLDDYSIAPYDDGERARLATLGILDTEDDPTVLLESSSGGLRIWFQQVPEPKQVKNRVHIDVSAPDIANEVARLRSLGATVATDQQASNIVLMNDPEGNEFCVVTEPA